MSKYTEITEWLARCPQLATLWNISAEQTAGANVLLPQGASTRRTMTERTDITGAYDCDITPTSSVYEDYQINCYRQFAANANEYNIMNLDDVQAVCDWIIERDEALDFPAVTGRKIFAIDVLPFCPQIRGIDDDTGLIAYYITMRIYYVNSAKQRSVHIDGDEL